MRLIVFVLIAVLSTSAIADEVDVEPLMRGEPAPWSGLLMRETRFVKMLRLQTDVTELVGKLAVQEKLFVIATVSLTAQLKLAQAKLDSIYKPDPWYKTRWFIFVAGVVAGSAAVVSLVQAVR